VELFTTTDFPEYTRPFKTIKPGFSNLVQVVVDMFLLATDDDAIIKNISIIIGLTSLHAEASPVQAPFVYMFTAAPSFPETILIEDAGVREIQEFALYAVAATSVLQVVSE